ncbi:helix-turn-helix domain-containing protein [Proteiniborus sp. MB09-C3]|uniref:helix-turn-helix domain-containing protein n=1 Tax=Proteiniborus sp. MB09-C3 TaxID=3050072 RepID=UPI002554B74E|nr:helix-turn-helix domain-containing protein [Proteiniborus sp. MB09-C3]WIV11843.1 helix-turn-helix domain-containing protein [Proteiniborus sp. MB09-C3]
MYYNLSLFGKKLCKLRQALGFAQDEIARLSSINIQTLRRIENGKVIPKQETLELLSPIYKKDLNNLLLKYRMDDYSGFNDIKNRFESKIDRDEFYTLDIELNELNNLLTNVNHPYFKLLIKQLIFLIEAIILNKKEKNQIWLSKN